MPSQGIKSHLSRLLPSFGPSLHSASATRGRAPICFSNPFSPSLAKDISLPTRAAFVRRPPNSSTLFSSSLPRFMRGSLLSFPFHSLASLFSTLYGGLFSFSFSYLCFPSPSSTGGPFSVPVYLYIRLSLYISSPPMWIFFLFNLLGLFFLFSHSLFIPNVDFLSISLLIVINIFYIRTN